MSVFYIVSRIG